MAAWGAGGCRTRTRALAHTNTHTLLRHTQRYNTQDIPTIIEAAQAERSERLKTQAAMRDTDNADTQLVLYLQVRVAWLLLAAAAP